jgi:lipopolysaccharide export system protein LptA
MSTGIRLTFITLICSLCIPLLSQAQTKKKVEILKCDLLDVNQRTVANAQRLLGNINIRVDGALMWCDSLYNYTNNNTVDAFGNVHIVRGDTLDMYADFINYNGTTKLAKARRNVKLIDKQVTLTTDSLDYSMTNDLASYNYSGTIKDSTNVLTSTVGQYYVNEKKAYFKTKVDVVTKDYKIKSDTLIYFTNTKKVFLEGPTHIFNETDTLYAEYGWYDSMKGVSKLTKKPRLWNAKQNVKADSIFYDKEKGEGLALGRARIQDIENAIIVTGNRVQYNDITKMAYATDSAVLIQYSEKDSLYLHADRLKTFPDTTTVKRDASSKKDKKTAAAKPLTKKEIAEKPIVDSLKITAAKIDSLAVKPVKIDTLFSTQIKSDSLAVQSKTDTTGIKPPKDPRIVLAYHKVRFFRSDLQGKCDSLVYWSKDSTIQLFTEPVIWSNRNQMTANYIEMINRTKDPDEVLMKEDAFIISMEDDSLRFNQIKGKNMQGYIRKNQLYKIDVNGNGQSNYYAKNQEGVIGLNKAESSNIIIYMNSGKVKKIAFIKSPDGELKPMADIEEGDKLLPGFKWLDDLRPKTKEEIFLDPAPEKPTVPAQPKVPAQSSEK